MVASLVQQAALSKSCVFGQRWRGDREQHQQQQGTASCARRAPGLQIWAVSVSKESMASETTAQGRKSTAQRPVVILPGLGNNTGDYTSLGAALGGKGLAVTVAKVSRPDWLRNAAGLLKADYWAGTLRPRPVLDWYLERVHTAITEAKAFCPDGKVSLVGHSAGGWLARLYLGEFGIKDVALLLTLGSPHLPPPKGVKGVIDQTRGLLNHIQDTYPGAFHAPEVKYVCISGRYIKGAEFFPAAAPKLTATGLGTVASTDGNDSAAAAELEAALGNGVLNASSSSEAPGLFRERLIGQGYKQVCGQSAVWGDGVVPEISAHLEGALNISLDNVYHSPVGANDNSRPWYGSKSILDHWVQHLLE